MDSPIRSLFTFFYTLEKQVEGRGAQKPPRDVEKMLLQLLQIEKTASERLSACEILRRHPAWIEWLADQIKKRRERPSSPH